jgi:hypothetical protein
MYTCILTNQILVYTRGARGCAGGTFLRQREKGSSSPCAVSVFGINPWAERDAIGYILVYVTDMIEKCDGVEGTGGVS